MDIDTSALREIDLFRDLPEPALAEIAQDASLIRVPAGDTLFQQGDPGDAFYLIQDGQIHIVRHYADGEDVVLATHAPYYVIGELSGVVGQERTGKVVAASDLELVKVPRVTLMKAIDHHPKVAVTLMLRLGMRLYNMQLKVREHAIGNLPARVAGILLLLSGGANGEISNDVSITRLARAAGTDADRMERLLEEWELEGWIAFRERRLTIKDVDALADIAG